MSFNNLNAGNKIWDWCAILLIYNNFNTNKKVWYKSPLSLTLISKEIDTFLDTAKRGYSEKEFNVALNDTIELADRNKTDIPHLLSSIHKTLVKRIKRIENLQGKTIDTRALIYGAGFISLGLMLSYAIYHYYKKWYYPNSCEMEHICKTLGAKGIKIRYKSNNSIEFDTPINFEEYAYTMKQQIADSDDQRRFIDLYNTNQNLEACGIIAASSSLLSFVTGIITSLDEGFNPHYDDKYLEKYKSFLIITEALMKEHAISYS